MPIVISEFEVVPEPPPTSEPQPDHAAPTVSQPPTPYQVALAIGHEWRRQARVKAD